MKRPKALTSRAATKGKPARPPKPQEEDQTFKQISDKFLQSRDWRKFRIAYLAEHPVCDKCKEHKAEHVHHTTPRRELPIEEWYDIEHLQPLCPPCHAKDKNDKWTKKWW